MRRICSAALMLVMCSLSVAQQDTGAGDYTYSVPEGPAIPCARPVGEVVARHHGLAKLQHLGPRQMGVNLAPQHGVGWQPDGVQEVVLFQAVRRSRIAMLPRQGSQLAEAADITAAPLAPGHRW